MSNKQSGVRFAVLNTIRTLAAQRRNGRVELSAIKSAVWEDPQEVDRVLLDLQDEGILVLYRNDNTQSLTKADHEAAIDVNGYPRHLAYLT